MTGGWTLCHIGIGSNLGDAHANVRQAVTRLQALPDTRAHTCSDLFATAPIDAGGDDYVNAVLRFEARTEATQLLEQLHAIERDFGRERPYRNAPRTLDLDLLLYGQQCIDMPGLTVPHPRITERAFVLIPLLQLDPDIRIPGHGPAHEYVGGVAGQAIRRL